MIHIIITLITYIVSADQLEQVQILWRHGARTPLHCNWQCEEFKKQNQLNGFLTPTGMRQHYRLGQWLRKRYIQDLKFLSEQFNMDEVRVQSTDVNRTLMSVWSNLQGMYPQGTGPLIGNIDEDYLKPPNPDVQSADIGNMALPFQMEIIPIHTREKKDEIYLRGYDTIACPRNAEFNEANSKSEMFKNVNQYSSELILEFANLMELDPQSLTIDDLYEYQDTFDTCVYNNYQMPQLSKYVTDRMKLLMTLVSELNNFQLYSQVMLQSTPFFKMINTTFQNKVDVESDLKYHIYSAHDTTVLQILTALNLTSAECLQQVYYGLPVTNKNCIYTFPGYASNLIFELYSRDDKSYYIQLYFNGTQVPICNQMTCELKEFQDIITYQSVPNYDEECLRLNSETEVSPWIGAVIIAVASLIAACLLMAFCLSLQIRRMQRRKIHRALEEV